MAFWTCIRTHPNQEKIAIYNLENQDFTYYQPKILIRKLRKQKVVNVEQPLFPCYLFVQVASRWACLNNTHGVSGLLMCGPAPAVVQDKVIDSLRQREQNGFVQLPKVQKFSKGDTVTIKTGAFAGQQALVDRMPAKERQKILLALLSGSAKVLIAEEELEAV